MRWFSSSGVLVGLPFHGQSVLPLSGSIWRRAGSFGSGFTHSVFAFWVGRVALGCTASRVGGQFAPPLALQAFSLSMGNGGVAYMVFGALAAALMGSRLLGVRRLLMFLIPAVGISLGQ
jgi:uncharacterized membrane protein